MRGVAVELAASVERPVSVWARANKANVAALDVPAALAPSDSQRPTL